MFSNDDALDVRARWRELLLNGEPAETASARILSEFGVDPDLPMDFGEEQAAVFALAAVQHDSGRLQPEVRDRAVALIDAGGDIEQWQEEAGMGRARAAVLKRLRKKLTGPQPPVRAVRRSPRPSDPGVARGDVIRVAAAEGPGFGLFGVLHLIGSPFPMTVRSAPRAHSPFSMTVRRARRARVGALMRVPPS